MLNVISPSANTEHVTIKRERETLKLIITFFQEQQVAMFIGIVGPACSGKHEVANLLTIHHGFVQLGLNRDSTEGTTTARSRSIELTGPPHKDFDTIEQMLDYVTLHWMDHFVTCDVHTVQGISILRKRPFFLLLSVESPMMMRYRRCVDR